MMIAKPWSRALHLSCPNQLTANRYAHALSSELQRFIKSLDKSQDGRRTTWISSDNITVQPDPNHSHAAWNWDVSLRFNKSSRERKIWIRSHRYLSIHRQEKQVPKFDSQKTHDGHSRWPERVLQKGIDTAKASFINGL